MKFAGAPISWGVCEVPGWGYQLAPDRVLAEMTMLGLAAAEFGPQGWLPAAAAERATKLAEAGLKAVGAFVPAVLHDPQVDPVPGVEIELDSFEAAGGDVLVLAAASGQDGYDERPILTPEQQHLLYANLERVAEAARARGIQPSLHPHVGTMVETADDVERVLQNTSVPLCLDTGHLLIGGADPAALVRRYASRINHVHAKDVKLELAAKVQSKQLSYTEAVREGIYVPLGQGDVDLASIVADLTAAGFDGWYVLEQDTILTAEPEGEGPMANVRASLEYLRGLALG